MAYMLPWIKFCIKFCVTYVLLDSKPSAVQNRKPKTKKGIEMAAKVALMKMKQTATGYSGIPRDSRVYLMIQLPGTGLDFSPFFFDQVCSLQAAKYLSK